MTNNRSLPTAQVADLDTLAEQARNALQRIGRAAGDFLTAAMDAGDVLIAAKEKLLEHGSFLSWVKRECSIGERQAENYMRLARGRAELGANPNRASDLSLRGALRLLSKQQAPAPQPSPRRKKTKKATPALDPQAFLGASPEDQRHFIDSIGWDAIRQALPPSWDVKRVAPDDEREQEEALPWATELFRRAVAAIRAASVPNASRIDIHNRGVIVANCITEIASRLTAPELETLALVRRKPRLAVVHEITGPDGIPECLRRSKRTA